MKNYIHKIAKDNIKKNSEFYKYIYVSIFLTFFIVFLTNILSSSMDKTLYEKRAISHGRWDVIISKYLCSNCITISLTVFTTTTASTRDVC